MEYHKNVSLEDLFYINDDGLVCCEKWKDIPHYENLYKASNLGRIMSLNYNGTKKNKILKTYKNNTGYLAVVLYKNKKRKDFKSHQLIAITFLSHTPCKFQLVINHINFNKIDNRVDNLEIITNRENSNQKHIKSSSKYTGVSWHKGNKKWCSVIVVNGKNKFLGLFDDEEEASKYYQNALLSIKNNTDIIVKKHTYTSKYKGVTWNKTSNKWLARITINKRRICLGYFKTEIEAYNSILTL